MNNMVNMDITSSSIIYTRCSTPNQNNPQYNSSSIESQLFMCTEFCKDNNLKILDHKTEICSGRHSKNQKVLLNLINNNSKINLIIFDISRFSRNIIDGMKMIEQCLQNNITIYSVKDNIIVKDNKQLNQITIALMNAQNESDAISFRVSQSIKYRKSLGGHIGKDYYGYNLIKENNIKKLKINDEEQLVVRLILKLKYGSTYTEVNNLSNLINKSDIKILDKKSPIIMYGNYENSDIAFLLNKNDIFRRGDIWTSNKIQQVVTKYPEYNTKKESLLDSLFEEFSKLIENNKNINKDHVIRSINILYEQLNGYPSNNIDGYNKLKKMKDRYDIISYLNDNNVNFKCWNVEDTYDYIENDYKRKRINYDSDYSCEL